MYSVANKGSNDPSKRLLTVRMNGMGKYENELHTSDEDVSNVEKHGLTENIDM